MPYFTIDLSNPRYGKIFGCLPSSVESEDKILRRCVFGRYGDRNRTVKICNTATGVVYECENKPADSPMYGIKWIELERLDCFGI